MKLLLDQDVYATTARLLTDLGHDLVQVAQIGLSQANDLLITRDRDFGGLVFVNDLGSGVIYLRILPSTQNSTHKELERVLKTYPENELMKAFVVVEPDRHRFRKLPR